MGLILAKSFLDLKYKVYGVDNFDDYYSKRFKSERIKILKKKISILKLILQILERFQNLLSQKKLIF